MTDFITTLQQFDTGLDAETARIVRDKLMEVMNYVPRIGVLGKTGAGKSSLCNALFGAETCKVSDVEACTRKAQEVPLSVSGEKRIVLVDVPGVGESRDRDDEYRELYSELLPDMDAVLWVLKADDRAYSVDIQFYQEVVKPSLDAGKPLLIVLNQVDKVEPFREWNLAERKPGPTQETHIERKRRDVANSFEVPPSSVVAVSVAERYGLTNLAEELVHRLPASRVLTVSRSIEKTYVSEKVQSRVRSSFLEVVKDAVRAVGTKVAEIASGVWDTVKSFFW